MKPAVYAGGNYQEDKRWWGNGDAPVDAVVIDNPPSEANRMEQALKRFRSELGLPSFQIDLTEMGDLPAHVPAVLTSFDLPHRHADAYFRDAVLTDGTPFNKSDIGASLLAASALNPDAILQWMPQSLVFGFWQSHQGKKGPQTKFARALDAEIVGYEPASTKTKRFGLKGDPLNLSVSEPLVFPAGDPGSWKLQDGAKSGASKSKDSLAEVGHGQVPVSEDQAPLGAISFRSVEQSLTVSFARLRNIEAGSPERNAAARALLAALGLVAGEAAFSGSFTLRSGCDLRPTVRTITWRGHSGDEHVESLGFDAALALFRSAADHASATGLPVGSAWQPEPVQLRPNAELSKAIQLTFGLDQG